jgi:hypothetical protein
MAIEGCPNCQGTGWVYRGFQKKYWYLEPCLSSDSQTFTPWELCWCSLGVIVTGPPIFWKDRERVNQVLLYPHEDLEKAVSDFLNQKELSSEQIRILKFYVAQWIMKDPQPPCGWLERLARCSDSKSLRDYVESLKKELIRPF